MWDHCTTENKVFLLAIISPNPLSSTATHTHSSMNTHSLSNSELKQTQSTPKSCLESNLGLYSMFKCQELLNASCNTHTLTPQKRAQPSVFKLTRFCEKGIARDWLVAAVGLLEGLAIVLHSPSGSVREQHLQ